MNHRVAIVGGGLAGLTCLHELRKLRVNAQLFEADSRVGGRISTHRLPDGKTVDIGAGYFHHYYGQVQRLVDELGLRARVVHRPSHGTGMMLGQHVVAIRSGSIISAVYRGVLGVEDVGSFAWLFLRAHWASHHVRRHFDNRGDRHRDGLHGSWFTNASRKPFSHLSRQLSPNVVGFIDAVSRKQLFQPAEQLNLATALLLLSSAATPLYTLAGGLEQLPMGLAARHRENILLGCPIRTLHTSNVGHNGRTFYQLEDQDGRHHGPYNHVVLATPLPRSSAILGRRLGPNYAPATVLVVEGELLPKFEGPGKIYVVGGKAGVHGITKYAPSLYKVGVDENFDLSVYFRSHRVRHRQDWQHGLPYTDSIGDVPAADQGDGLWLAGDYMLPCMESAAHSGYRAAQGIHHQMREKVITRAPHSSTVEFAE